MVGKSIPHGVTVMPPDVVTKLVPTGQPPKEKRQVGHYQRIDCENCGDAVGWVENEWLKKPNKVASPPPLARCKRGACSPDPDIADMFCPNSYHTAPDPGPFKAIVKQHCDECGLANVSVTPDGRYTNHFKKGCHPSQRKAGPK